MNLRNPIDFDSISKREITLLNMICLTMSCWGSVAWVLLMLAYGILVGTALAVGFVLSYLVLVQFVAPGFLMFYKGWVKYYFSPGRTTAIDYDPREDRT